MLSRFAIFFVLFLFSNTLCAYASSEETFARESSGEQTASWDWYICTQNGISSGLHAGVASYLCGGQAWASYTDKLFENQTLSASMTVDECADALFEIIPEDELESSCYKLMERSQTAEVEDTQTYNSI